MVYYDDELVGSPLTLSYCWSGNRFYINFCVFQDVFDVYHVT